MMAAIYENGFYNGFNTPFHNRAYESTTVDSLFASLPDFKTKATDAWNGIAEGRFSGLAPLFEDGPFDDGKRTTTHGKTNIDDRFFTGVANFEFAGRRCDQLASSTFQKNATTPLDKSQRMI